MARTRHLDLRGPGLTRDDFVMRTGCETCRATLSGSPFGEAESLALRWVGARDATCRATFQGRRSARLKASPYARLERVMRRVGRPVQGRRSARLKASPYARLERVMRRV